MPFKPLTPCAQPGCRNLTHGGRCEAHKRKAWEGNKESKRMMKGRTLQGERDWLFSEFPLCVECLKVGRDTPSVIRDHIIPLAEGGEDTAGNTQALCEECHDRKSKEEARRGRLRSSAS